MVFLSHIINNNGNPVYNTAALNERYYGKLQGRKKQKNRRKILPAVAEEKNVIICAHQGNLRALLKYIEDISDTDIGNPIYHR